VPEKPSQKLLRVLRSFPAAPSGSAGKPGAAIPGGPFGGTNVHRTFVKNLRLTLTRLTAARDVFETVSEGKSDSVGLWVGTTLLGVARA
jgi:hypothetical protein